MIFVAGKHITQVNEFTPDFLTLLDLIKDGRNWLIWALNDPSLSVYYAQGEDDLLIKIQNGLHESPLIKGPVFQMHIEKAIATEEADLKLLLAMFNQPNNSEAAIESLTTRYGLVTNPQLGSIYPFLNRHSLAQAPVLQTLDLTEQLEFYQFMQANKQNELLPEAMNFVLPYSATCSEFVNYSQFYLHCAAHQLTTDDNDNSRPDQVKAIYDQLSNLSYRLINVTNMGQQGTAEQIAKILPDFLENSNFIGYRLNACAMANLARNIRIAGADENTLKTDIETFNTSIKQKISGQKFSIERIPQAGGATVFQWNNGQFKVAIEVESNGDVFLAPMTGPM